jgi:EmrB/QacA subfamily drug resistance transporter
MGASWKRRMTKQRTSTTSRATTLDREILTLGGVVVLGAIMTVLDLTVVNVAIPTLARAFGASVATIQWVATGYMLAVAGVIPLTGWASERFGSKRVWIASLVLFLTGSVLSGAAWSLESLIAFRVLQGLGAGIILPVGQTILAQAAGPSRMGRVMSIIGVPMLLAPVFGPVLGGAIIDSIDWRWIFYLNLPIGALALIAAWRLLPGTPARRGTRLDLRGLLLLSPGIALFLYGVAEAGNAGGLAGTNLAATVLGALLVVLFIGHGIIRGQDALIDLSLFARRTFAAAAATNVLVPAGLFGTLFLLPLYYQVVRDESPLTVGVLLIPQGLGAAVAMPIAGWLTDRIGSRRVVVGGLVLALLGIFAYTGVAADTSYAYLMAALFVLGLGLGSTFMPSMAAAFQTLSHDETPRATSALNALQRIAGAIGTAGLAIVLQRGIADRLAAIPGGLAGFGQLPAAQRLALTGPLADAFAAAFWVALSVMAIAVLPALLLPDAAPARNAAVTTPARRTEVVA